MTITATASEIAYLGDAVTVAFAIPFPFDTSADIKVVTTVEDEEPEVLATGFSITGGSGSTGTCTFDVAPDADVTITILDDPELTQTADYEANDAFAEDAHEGALDRTVRQVKRLHQRVERSLRVADGDESSGDDLLIPIVSVRQGKFLAFDADGQPYVSDGTAGADSALRDDLASAVASNDGARLVGFRRTEAGSVIRTVFSVLAAAPWTPEDFGAVGDGVTDDHVAVQAWLNAGSRLHGLSGAVYHCGSTTLTVPADTRIFLYGSKLKSAVVSATFLNITGDNVEIHGGEIEGRGGASASTSAEILIKFSGASAAAYRDGLKIKDCYIHGSGFYGVYAQFSKNAEIVGCKISDLAYAGVMVQSGTNWKVNGNSISDIVPGSAGLAYGVSFSRDDGALGVGTHPRPAHCEANDNTVWNIPLWEALDTHGGQDITFSRNHIYDCLYGINASPSAAASLAPMDITITDNTIDSGTLSADPGRAIGSGGLDAVTKASNFYINGNMIRGFGAASNSDGAVMLQYTEGLTGDIGIIEDSRGSALCLLQGNDEFNIGGGLNIRGVRAGVANAAGINIRNTTQTGHIGNARIDATAEYALFIANSNPGVSFGKLRLITSGTQIQGAAFGGEGLELEGAVTTDVADIPDGDQAQFNITVAGAELGDYVVGVACSISTAALSLTGTITAADTVTAVLQNNTGGAVNLLSATYTALVRKR